jgi:putative peptide zinc metalloprotease protein
VAEPPLAIVAPSPGSVVRFRTLHIRPSDDDSTDTIVGRPEIGEFIELPTVFADAIQLLDSGMALSDAEREIRARHGADADLSELVEALAEVGFIASVDGRAVPDPFHAPPSHLPWLRPGHVRWMFGTPAKLAYAALITAALVTVVDRPDLLPTYRDFYWTHYIGLAVLANTAVFSVFATIHELGHLVAARSLGAPGRISFATRLHHLVLQTDVTAVWGVARKYRYRVYLSGILCDIAVVCVSILLTAYGPLAPLAQRILAALILTMVASTAMQAQVFMRTDLYFVLLDLLRCRNLFHDALAYARHLIRRAGHAFAPARIAAGIDPSADLPIHERRAVRIYSVAVVVGSGIALGGLVLYGIPILIYGVATAISAVVGATAGGSIPAAVDSGLLILVEGTIQVTFLVTFYRRYRHGRHRAGLISRDSHRTTAK